MSKKLSTNEATASRIFMIVVSHGAMERKDKLGEIMRRLPEGTFSEKSPDKPIYDVEFKVNGVELDFKLFEEYVLKELDHMVTEAAGELMKERMDSLLFSKVNDLEDAVQKLTEAMRAEAAKLLGYNPWNEE